MVLKSAVSGRRITRFALCLRMQTKCHSLDEEVCLISSHCLQLSVPLAFVATLFFYLSILSLSLPSSNSPYLILPCPTCLLFFISTCVIFPKVILRVSILPDLILLY